MTERQSHHLNRLVKRFVNRFVPKFTGGTVEHPGDLQDVPLLTMVRFGQEEVLDQWSYLGTAEEQICSVIELVNRLDDSPLKFEILQRLQGRLPDQSNLPAPGDGGSN